MAHEQLGQELLTELPETISSLVKEIVEDEEEAQTAITRIVDEVKASDEYDSVVDILVRKGVSAMVWRYRSELNRKKRNSPSPPTPVVSAPTAPGKPSPRRTIPVTVDLGRPKFKQITPLVAKAYRIGYNYNLYGKRLGKMIKEELLDAARQCRTQEGGIRQHRRTWLAIAGRMGKGSVVSECVTEEEIDEIFESFAGK